MNEQEILTQIDHIITEVDLELHQWQEDLDMMSFIGINAEMAMWTDEVPPRIVTARNITLLPLQGITDVKVMHFTKDGWTKVGTAKISETGNFIAKLDHDIPGITDVNYDFSLDNVGNMKPVLLPAFPRNPPFEGFNKSITKATPKFDPPFAKDVYGFEDMTERIKNLNLENHPFFNTKEEK